MEKNKVFVSFLVTLGFGVVWVLESVFKMSSGQTEVKKDVESLKKEVKKDIESLKTVVAASNESHKKDMQHLEEVVNLRVGHLEDKMTGLQVSINALTELVKAKPGKWFWG